MSTNNDNKKPAGRKAPANSGGNVAIMDVIFRTLRFWPLILLSVAVCVGGAYFYLLRIPNTYTRSAEILIKEDAYDQGNALEKIGKSRSSTMKIKMNMANEIIALQSPNIMEEVARRLRLDMNYYHPGQFYNAVAYGPNLPVKVEIPNLSENSSLSFNLNVDKNGAVSISKIAGQGVVANDKVYGGKLNAPIATPVGKMIVKPTPTYVSGDAVHLIVAKIPIDAARDGLRRISVNVSNEEASIIKLMVADQSIERADDILNTLIDVYNENWIADKNQIAVSTSNFINDRLGIIERELGNVENEISSYKSSNLITDIEAVSSMAMAQNEQAKNEIINLNTQLQMARYIRSYIEDAKLNQLLPTNTGASGNIQTFIDQYNQKVIQRNNLVAKSSETNPLVLSLNDEMSAQRMAMLKTIDNEILAMNNQLRILQNAGSQARSQLASNPNQAKYLLSVERQQKVKESLYLFLLQRREENELNQAFTAYNTRVINQPGFAGVPTTPNRTNTLALAFIIGLFLPFGASYAYEAMNTKVRGRKDIEDISAPFIGEIPLSNSNRQRRRFKSDVFTKAIVVKAGKRDVVNEAFRVVRTNLEFMKIHRNEADVVAITSFNPGSGKSFITMNMAVALALKGKKVLVIDGDLRHGSTSAYIDSPESGLSDYLSGSVDDVSSLIYNDKDLPSLYVLPIGTMPPNPTELLETSRFSDFVTEMRQAFDYILIDCPPIEVVADAQIIDRIADRTIFVVRVGLLERGMLAQLDKLHEEKKYKNMAIILNGTEIATRRYGYSHGYRYGYGYGYAYGKNYAGKE